MVRIYAGPLQEVYILLVGAVVFGRTVCRLRVRPCCGILIFTDYFSGDEAGACFVRLPRENHLLLQVIKRLGYPLVNFVAVLACSGWLAV